MVCIYEFICKHITNTQQKSNIKLSCVNLKINLQIIRFLNSLLLTNTYLNVFI